MGIYITPQYVVPGEAGRRLDVVAKTTVGDKWYSFKYVYEIGVAQEAA